MKCVHATASDLVKSSKSIKRPTQLMLQQNSKKTGFLSKTEQLNIVAFTKKLIDTSFQ